MAQDYAKAFYGSPAWQQCRKAYKKSVGGLCERCLKKGLYTPAVIVHHKVYISPENLQDAHIALDWNNLEALCRQCHEEEHIRGSKRYRILEDGSIQILK